MRHVHDGQRIFIVIEADLMALIGCVWPTIDDALGVVSVPIGRVTSCTERRAHMVTQHTLLQYRTHYSSLDTASQKSSTVLHLTCELGVVGGCDVDHVQATRAGLGSHRIQIASGLVDDNIMGGTCMGVCYITKAVRITALGGHAPNSV